MSLRDKAYQHIHKRILTGQLRPGDVISEAAVASEIGISRTPVREAIKHLQAAGLVDQVPRYGTIVRQPEYRDIIELFQLRAALETFALTASEDNLSEAAYRSGLALCRQLLDIAREMQRDDATAMDPDQLNRFLTADMAFHMVFLNAAGNQRIVKLVTDVRAQIRSCGAGRPDHSLKTIVRAYRYHRRILRCVRRGNIGQAQHWMRDHLRDSLQATLTHLLQIDPERGSDSYFSLFQQPVSR
jgi:DNA-binding GntR family transcriptional regulator